MLVVLLGGARSGKSQLAVTLAEEAGAPVTFVATAEARDEEMQVRIAAHQAERPIDWHIVEEPLSLVRAITAVPADRTLIVDCLTLWVSNALEVGDDALAIADTARIAARTAAERTSLTVVVSNEVGLGLVPMSPLARTFRDTLGTVNRIFVDASHEAALMVAGRRLDLPRGSGS